MIDDHFEPSPLRKHKIYYPALKIAVLAVAVGLGCRFFGVL
jgi:hypothetical protein